MGTRTSNNSQPVDIEARLRRHRARLGRSDLERDLDEGLALPDEMSPVERVLVTGSTKLTEHDVQRCFERLRAAVEPGVRVRFLTPIAPLRIDPERFVFRGRKGRTDLVDAVRLAGWCITEIERIVVEEGESASCWADLEVIDLEAEIAELS